MSLQFHHQKLPNGLTVLAEADPAAHTAAVGFFVRTGTRDETPQLMGVSHFLEHMMFKGTARRSADDVNREFDEIGADYNAFTSHEQTVYYAHVLPEQLHHATDLFADMLRPALRDDDFDMEKKVIIEEIGMYDDRPNWRLQDTLLETYFGDHPLGYRVLGTNDTIDALTSAQMRGYFEQRYSPDNIVVAAAGNLDFEALVSDLSQRTESWQPSNTQRDHGKPVAANSQHTIEDPRVHRHYLAAMWPAPSAQDQTRYAAKILADVLGDTEGSRLYWSLIDPGLADEADLSFQPLDRAGSYLAYASCDPKRSEEVERILLETLANVGDDLNNDEITRAKNKLATSATLQGERPRGRMMSLGSTWSYLEKYLPLETELEQIMAVTLDDVRALLEACPAKPATLIRLTPKT